MTGLLLRLPLYWLSRKAGFPRILPASITVSVTRKCNSRCLTCNVWKESSGEELTADEFGKVFRSIGRAPQYITFSGGEPFLRRDFKEICRSAIDICRPAAVTIPTNGLLTERIRSSLEEILSASGKTRVILNLSLDGIGPDHDEIRGVPGCFDKLMATYEAVRGIGSEELQVGFHTVISRHNVRKVPQIFEFVEGLGADSYITEIAEERVELGTMGSGIAPGPEDYQAAARFLQEAAGRLKLSGLARVIRVIRKSYYGYVMDILTGGNRRIDCYAGTASGQINSNGDVWFCCIKAEPVGNLRDAGYDFGRIWFSRRADEMRKDIDASGCRCPLANAYYTNVLFSPIKALRLMK